MFVVLPVFNEAQALTPLMERFLAMAKERSLSLRFIAVNDGSCDDSTGVLKAFQDRLAIEIVEHPINLGLGKTILDGLRRAASEASSADVIITLDADNTQPPELIPSMLEKLEAGHELVIASRYQPGAQVVGLSRFRLFMSYGARIVFQTFVPIAGVRDYTCGFRAYGAARLQSVLQHYGNSFSQEKGFASAVEILLKFAAEGARICEVPLVLRYDRKVTPSKMNVGATVMRHLVLAWRNRFLAPSRTKGRSTPASLRD